MKNDRLSSTNPLRGLDVPGLVNMLEMGERGYYADLAWLYRFVLKRNGVARAVRRKLTSALGRLDWNIKIPDDLDDARKAKAERQQETLRRCYDAVGNLNDAIVHLAFPEIMGFAHLNKVYAGAGAKDPWQSREFRIVPQWHMCRDGLFAPWCYNPEATNTNRGLPINPRDWIFREVDDPAAEIFAFAHIKMMTTDEDWDQFLDTYAVNPIFIEGPPNARPEDEARYQQVAEQIVSDGRGYLPSGAKPHVVTPGTGGSSVFTERLRYYREEIVLAGTGGILGTLAGEGSFGDGGASDSHEDTWLDIAAAIGGAVSTALQRQFDRLELARLHKGEEVLAYFALDKPEHDRDASDVLGDAKLARDAGFAMDAEEASEKTGYKLTPIEITSSQPGNEIPKTEGAPGTHPGIEAAPEPGVAPPPQPTTAPDGKPAEAAASKLPAASSGREKIPPSAKGEADESLVTAALANDLGVEERWLAPVKTVLDEVEAMIADPAVTTNQIEAKLQEAIKAMPELLGQLDVGELAQALENASGPAAVQGLADGLRAKTTKAKV